MDEKEEDYTPLSSYGSTEDYKLEIDIEEEDLKEILTSLINFPESITNYVKENIFAIIFFQCLLLPEKFREHYKEVVDWKEKYM